MHHFKYLGTGAFHSVTFYTCRFYIEQHVAGQTPLLNMHENQINSSIKEVRLSVLLTSLTATPLTCCCMAIEPSQRFSMRT